MANATTLVLCHAVKPEEYPFIKDKIIEGHKLFQAICEVGNVMLAQKSSRPNSRSASPTPGFRRGSTATSSAATEDMGDDGDDNESVQEFQIDDGGEDQGSKRMTAKKFTALQKLPNVHQGLHIGDLAGEWGTANNMAVLMGETNIESSRV